VTLERVHHQPERFNVPVKFINGRRTGYRVRDVPAQDERLGLLYPVSLAFKALQPLISSVFADASRALVEDLKPWNFSFHDLALPQRVLLYASAGANLLAHYQNVGDKPGRAGRSDKGRDRTVLPAGWQLCCEPAAGNFGSRLFKASLLCHFSNLRRPGSGEVLRIPANRTSAMR
jgi:hypothetical protein